MGAQVRPGRFCSIAAGSVLAGDARSWMALASRSVPRLIDSQTIQGVVVVEPDPHGDERGRFVETYRRSWFPAGREMIQANRSEKLSGALVGLHYHLHQADYWYLLRGKARVVLHDLRSGSPTDMSTQIVELDGEEDRGIFIPPGVAHGFAAVTDVLLWYLVDAYYNPADELGLAWDDPDVGADCGIDSPVLSVRDQSNPLRSEITDAWRPHHGLRS